MSKVLIVGFVNRTRCVPDGIITVVKMPDGFYARWPHPNTEKNFIKILDITRVEELSSHGDDIFWVDNSGRMLDIDRNEFAYAFSREQIFIGTIEEQILEIRRQMELKVLPQEALDYFENEFFASLKKNPELCRYL
ncbi:MAG: hypothetical protein WC791_04160 [Candidatus Paceibacterota bacterium]|jgi:hypothetical protein